MFNWFYSLKENEFEKDIELYIDDSVFIFFDDVDVFYIEVVDEFDIKLFYLKKFKMKGKKRKV